MRRPVGTVYTSLAGVTLGYGGQNTSLSDGKSFVALRLGGGGGGGGVVLYVVGDRFACKRTKIK